MIGTMRRWLHWRCRRSRVPLPQRGAIQVEWTLLTGGLNAPANIHVAQPLVSNDGADGADGLCGKNG